MSGGAFPPRQLALPLPHAAHQQGLVAAFWLELVSRFLRKADFELVLLITEIAESRGLA